MQSANENDGNSIDMNGLGLNTNLSVNGSRDLQDNTLIRNILDLALSRIRSNNSEFSNAVLTRAHIRVRGK